MKLVSIEININFTLHKTNSDGCIFATTSIEELGKTKHDKYRTAQGPTKSNLENRE